MTAQIKEVRSFCSLYARTLKYFGLFSLNNIPCLSLEIMTGGVHNLLPSLIKQFTFSNKLCLLEWFKREWNMHYFYLIYFYS